MATKYLIWYVQWENQPKLIEKQRFIEYTSIKAFNKDLLRLRKNPMVSRLKHTTFEN